VYVGHLRQKLGAQGAQMIGTEAGIGYRLVEGDETVGDETAGDEAADA